ncbi:MAG TPA: DUF308 domain-containing protein [Rhizomicrobium sp.]|nr:DUF308 domain-containing protein [Rhizomicrobium sp.]
MTTVTRSLRDFWAFLVTEGVILIVLGMLAIATPPVFGLFFVALLGWLLIVSGLTSLIVTALTPYAPGFKWALLSSMLTVVVGIFLFLGPKQDMTVIAFSLAAFLFLDGLLSILIALEHRRRLTLKWIWLLMIGAADLLLAMVMTIILPGLDAWLIGAIVGIDMLVSGLALVVTGIDLRALPRAHPHHAGSHPRKGAA